MTFCRRGAVRGGVLLAAGVCACTTLGSRQVENGVFTSEGVASATSFECSRQAVSGMGYTVSWSSGTESLRAERRGGDGANEWRGYLTVAVSRESSGHYLQVSAERYAEPSRLPVPATPAPQPTPVPTPPLPGTIARRTTRRVGPGPVAGDARNVVRRCALNGESSFAVR